MPPNVNKTVLDNGVRVITLNMPHVRSVAMGVWVNAGARDESPAENGISHLIEHMIFKGTRKRSAYQIAKEFDAIGGQTNAFTAFENTCYHARVMDTHLPRMVEILSDILLHSVFDDREIDRERPVILQEISMVEDNPDEYVHVLSGRDFWGDHPLGRSILGTPENLYQFDTAEVRRFFSHIYQPDRIIISAAGRLDHDEFIRMTAGEFESIVPGDRLPERLFPEPHSRLAIHEKALEQAHLCVMAEGLSITDSRRYVFALVNTLIGGNMSSRLFQEIREKRGLAYAVYSFTSSFVDTGMFGVYAGVSPDRLEETFELVLEALEAAKASPVDPQELEKAKEYTKGNLLLALESNENQMVRLAQNEMHFHRYTPVAEVLEKIDRVTPEDIQALAEELFQSGRLAVTLLGPVGNAGRLEAMLAASPRG